MQAAYKSNLDKKLEDVVRQLCGLEKELYSKMPDGADEEVWQKERSMKKAEGEKLVVQYEKLKRENPGYVEQKTEELLKKYDPGEKHGDQFDKSSDDQG